MDIKFKKIGDIEIEKQKFHSPKYPISICDVNIERIIVSKKVSFDEKNILLGTKMIIKKLVSCM